MKRYLMLLIGKMLIGKIIIPRGNTLPPLPNTQEFGISTLDYKLSLFEFECGIP